MLTYNGPILSCSIHINKFPTVRFGFTTNAIIPCVFLLCHEDSQIWSKIGTFVKETPEYRLVREHPCIVNTQCVTPKDDTLLIQLCCKLGTKMFVPKTYLFAKISSAVVICYWLHRSRQCFQSCVLVCLSVHGVVYHKGSMAINTHCTEPCPPLYRALPLDMFKLVQIGPHCTGTPFKTVHNIVRTVGRWAVGIWMCLLVNNCI